jgi:hypothetical protein
MVVFDCEGNGLNPDKFWCLSMRNANNEIKSTTSYKTMRKFLTTTDVLIGHNITRWDIPNLERVLDIKINAKLVDTLAISWYLYPSRVMHGLESWGVDLGVAKPAITDWDNLTIKEYVHRCEEDVQINGLLWDKMWKHLMLLYGSEEEVWRLLDYLSFKMSVAREQEEVKWKLDVDRAQKLLESFSKEISEKTEGLALAMPKVPQMASKSYPKKFYKLNGDVSAQGQKWLDLCKEQGLPLTNTEDIEYCKSLKEPNPGSHQQIKSWLYDLGWEPETFKYVRDKETGDVRKIEQINKPFGGGVCPSIKRLIGREPSLELLDGLSVLTHRLSIVKGFLSDVDEDGYVQAQVQGLTNTLRWKHRVCVNLPGIDKPYGADIRGCLVAPRGYKLCGSDMSSLEDRTKQHYMWSHDPEYVKEMMTDDFDPHLDLCVSGGLLTSRQVEDHKAGKADYSKQRKLGKASNYSCVYGAGGATVARAAGITEREGTKLVEAYWKRNWSVEAIAAEQRVKVLRGQKWLYNPVSKLWYSLRAEKDRFSTLNQGTGVWCFDTWVKYQREAGLVQVAQFHDETVNLVKEGDEIETKRKLRWAIDKTNEELSLNRELDIDIQFGYNYSEIH